MQTNSHPHFRTHRNISALPAWLVLGMLLGALFLYLFPPDVRQLTSPAAPPPGAPRQAVPSLFVYPVGLSEANAACSNQCTIQVCVRWIPGPSAECPRPGPGGGCCTDYESECDPECSDPDPVLPPAISAGQSCSQNGSNGWCTGTLTLNLSASDPQGQTVLISGNVGGTAFACANGATSCNVPLPEGSGTANYTVTSASGLSANGSQSFKRDGTPPQINGNLSGTGGDNGWYVSDVAASASASDPASGVASFQYSLDGSAWANYSSALSLSDGEHTLDFRASDSAGNQNQISQTVNVDTITPVLDLSLTGTPGEGSWYTSNVQIAASASDSGSGVDALEYELDDGGWTDYSIPAGGNDPLTLSDGVHSLSFRALDEAGNETQSDQDIYVDTQTPLLNLSISGTAGDGGWYVSDIEVSATASDLNSGLDALQYSVGNGAWTDYTSALPYSDGQYSLRFRAIDNAGNVTITPAQLYKVDNVPPGIDLPSAWNLGQTVDYEVTDSESGVASVRIVIEDDLERWPKLSWYGFAKDEIAWDGRWADKNRALDGEYFASIKASDWAGNESSKEAIITVENNLLTLLLPPFNPPADQPPLSEAEGEGDVPITSFGGDSVPNDSPTTTGLFSAGGVTTVAGVSGTVSFASPAVDTSSTGSPIPGVPQSDILWGAAAVAAVGAFTEEIARRKRAEDAARAASAEQRAKKTGKKDKAPLTYKQIAAAYQASLNNFKAALKNAQAKGMSASQAEALRKQVAQSGTIGGALGVAQGYVEPKAAKKGNAAPPKAPVKPPAMPTGLSPEAQQAFLRGGSGAQAWINSNAPQLQQQHAQDVAAAKQVTGKGKTVAKPAEDKIDPPPPAALSLWDQAKAWIEDNVVEPIEETVVEPAQALADGVKTRFNELIGQPYQQSLDSLSQFWESHVAKPVRETLLLPLQTAATNQWQSITTSIDETWYQLTTLLKPDGNPGLDGTEATQYQTQSGNLFIMGSGDNLSIHPNDINQGGVGDCYLLSSLAEIALQDPPVIRNMVADNGDGTYSVTFYRKSLFGGYVPVIVTITPDLPINQSGNLEFAHQPDSPELWPMLIEKAWAQYNGSYPAINGGWGNEMMESLTGVPSQAYIPSEVSIKELADAFSQGDAMTASTQSDWLLVDQKIDLGFIKTTIRLDLPNLPDSDPLFTGTTPTLHADHEYYVVGVDEQAGTITVRNPWGWRYGEITLTLDEFQRTFQRVSVNPLP